MKLRTKLFVGLLIYLFVYAVFIFIFPTYVVVSDIQKVADQMHKLIVANHKNLVRDQEILVSDIFQRMRTNINAILFMIYESNVLTDGFEALKKHEMLPVWDAAIKISSFNPYIGLVQVNDVQMNEVVVVSPAETTLYPIETAKIDDRFIAILVANELYLGVELPKNFQNQRDFTYYSMLSWEKALEEFDVLQKEAGKVQENLHSKELDSGQLFPDIATKWLYKMEMVRVLAPLIVKKTHDWVPEGLARIGNDNMGFAIFSKELFSQSPISNPVKFYEENSPPRFSPPIAEGDFYIHHHPMKHIYLANTLNLDEVYITLGSSLDTMAQEFANWAKKPVLITIGDQIWKGFDGQGDLYSKSALESFLQTHLLNKESGVIEYKGNHFFFDNLARFEGKRLGIYELSLLDGKDSVAKLSLTVAQRLAWKISFQLFLVSLIIIALMLLLASRIALRIIIKPIVRLAHVTKQVVDGQYEEIKWPNVGKRKDEVAVLTHSFEEMVKGLEEKEKIRSVLDKVVSKDVANEILKSQIHLGGEDRIVSTLFGDIRGFSRLTETMSPQKTIELLNTCMTKITQIIEGEGGVIDKFVGDAIMAIYGAPTTCADHALRAVSSGVLILQALKKWNEERVAKGEPRVEMGVGINTGVVVAGNMGAVDRLNYTVLGKNVNISSRLCAVAKPQQLIISEQTLNEPGVKESFFIEPLPSVMLKGFSEPFHIYHVIDFKWHK